MGTVMGRRWILRSLEEGIGYDLYEYESTHHEWDLDGSFRYTRLRFLWVQDGFDTIACQRYFPGEYESMLFIMRKVCLRGATTTHVLFCCRRCAGVTSCCLKRSLGTAALPVPFWMEETSPFSQQAA